jgi:hypothetical protein
MLQLSFGKLSLFNWWSLFGLFFDWLKMTSKGLLDVLFLLTLCWRLPWFLSYLGLSWFFSDFFLLLRFDLLLNKSSFLGRF